ncbi:TEF transcription factor, PAR bZIP family member a isoform X2 [Cyprinodon tularosa]|uniref:TEF transcription factor, PAR bZIP family member a n=1 Tax=Cyprinodon variegatus TaxID=28743 RepID=A0A3Q2CI57_CYPVA|nr:PREDICTED: thyrotroph embryonic factor-like isoform X2 [Cyprinodon variegatus]XP_038152696.1 TEF transcription factor, PAR bZIP family member a isoform X2 [Cyprinodon tularosa]
MTTEIPEIFRALLEHPFTLPNFDDSDTDKEKLGLGGNADLAGGGSDMGPSAALTPAIWEKTIPYDGESFHLEYMDLEEFLMENGIPISTDDASLKESPAVNAAKTEKVKSSAQTKPAGGAPVTLLPIPELERCEEEVVIITKSDSDVTCDVSTEVTTSQERATPDPIDPDEIEVDVNYEPDPTDLVLSSVPGGELFDPRKHKFSEEELKPQPMIKKAKKVFVPEEQKDDKYWQRRKKNNMAAKRSRDARRLKENQITVRAAFLERENSALRQEVAELRKECGRYKNVVGRYEAKYGPIAVPDDE